ENHGGLVEIRDSAMAKSFRHVPCVHPDQVAVPGIRDATSSARGREYGRSGSTLRRESFVCHAISLLFSVPRIGVPRIAGNSSPAYDWPNGTLVVWLREPCVAYEIECVNRLECVLACQVLNS